MSSMMNDECQVMCSIDESLLLTIRILGSKSADTEVMQTERLFACIVGNIIGTKEEIERHF